MGKVWPTMMAMLVTVGMLSHSTSEAHAQDGWGINGTFTATSNGDWAKVNDIFQNVPSVRATWTVRTTCQTPVDCVGTVTSDQGWTARITTTNGQWMVTHVVDNWQQCPDGTAASGRQLFKFYGADDQGLQSLSSTTYVGIDEIVNTSGDCGRSKWLSVRMPFKLVKLA
jgi:hypothetical protein